MVFGLAQVVSRALNASAQGCAPVRKRASDAGQCSRNGLWRTRSLPPAASPSDVPARFKNAQRKHRLPHRVWESSCSPKPISIVSSDKAVPEGRRGSGDQDGPLDRPQYLEKGCASSPLRQDDQGLEWLQRAVAAAPEWPLPQAMLAAALPVAGHETEAHETLSRYLSLSGTTVRTNARWKEQMPSDNLAFFWPTLNGFRRDCAKAGMPEE
jgi:hypothetical protein